MKKIIYSVIILCLFISVQNLKAQNLDQTLNQLADVAVKPYVAPVISAFGSNLNSGWVSELPSGSMLSFHLNFKIVAMGSFFNSDQKTFSQDGSVNLSDQAINSVLESSGYTPGSAQYIDLSTALSNQKINVNFAGPTIIGDKNKSVIMTIPQQTFTYGGNQFTVQKTSVPFDSVKGKLGNLKALPTAALQASIGTVFGTNLVFRYFPDVNIKDLGKFSFWGIGFIHNVNGWLPVPLPLDLGIGYFYQKLKVGDVFESDASQFGIYASKTLGFFTPYAGLTTEKSTTTVSYTYKSNPNDVGTKIAFDLDGVNSAGAMIGFSLNLVIFKLNVDYKAAKISTVSAGITFGN
jgi:hypothetical protein